MIRHFPRASQFSTSFDKKLCENVDDEMLLAYLLNHFKYSRKENPLQYNVDGKISIENNNLTRLQSSYLLFRIFLSCDRRRSSFCNFTILQSVVYERLS